MIIPLALALAVQLQIPQPTGYVNDFADIIDSPAESAMRGVIDEVRQKSGGEIVVVTLPELNGRPSMEVARDIGRQWGVGATGGAGDRARNAGVIVLLVPGERLGDGRASLAIATGTGAEGFLPDARVGRIRDAIGQTAVDADSYGTGLTAGVWLLGEAYAEEFEFELTGTAPVRISQPRTSRRRGGGLSQIISFVIMMLIFSSIPPAASR